MLKQSSLALALCALATFANAQLVSESAPAGAVPNTFNETINGGSITIANQVASGTQGLVSSAYATATNPVAYVASDFVIPAGQPLRISSISADGFLSPATAPAVTVPLTASVGIDYAICTDAAGIPACADPNVASPQRVFFQTVAPTAAGLTFGGTDVPVADITLNLITANINVTLQPGTYWLIVAPRWNAAAPGTGNVNGRWNWAGTPTAVGAQSHLVSPVVFVLPTWTPFSGLGATVTARDTAFVMLGIPGAAPINSNPVSGSTIRFSVPVGGSASSTISFTGGPGTLTCTAPAGFTLSSSTVTVPGTLTITAAGAAQGNLTCTGGGFNGTYGLSSAFAVQAPSLNIIGMLALLAGVVLLGGFAVRRFS
jgi:hypothetical protein